MNINNHRSFIFNIPKLEKNKMSFKRWLIKQTIIHPYLISNKKERIDSQTWDRSQGLGRVKKRFILYESIYETFSKWQNQRGGREIMVDKGPGRCVGSTRKTFVAIESVS